MEDDDDGGEDEDEVEFDVDGDVDADEGEDGVEQAAEGDAVEKDRVPLVIMMSSNRELAETYSMSAKTLMMATSPLSPLMRLIGSMRACR